MSAETVMSQPKTLVLKTAIDPQAVRETGYVKFFDDLKGFGFISRSNGGDIFVHHTGILGKGYKTLNDGARIEFTVAEGPKGFYAKDVIPLKE